MNGTALPVEEGNVPAEGTLLFYVALGDGPPVIVVSGGPGLGHSYLRPWLDPLARQSRLIYYDQRGTGRSEAGDREPTLAGSVEDLEALRAGLGIDRAGLIGHSFGAILAILYAAAHPDRVASLVLADPAPPFDPEQREALWIEMRGRVGAEYEETMERIMQSEGFGRRDPGALEEFIRTMYRPFFRNPRSSANMNLAFTRITARHIVGAEEAWIGEFSTLDPAAAAGRVTAPTLILRGEMEPVPEAFAHFLAGTIRQARYTSVPGANHFPFLEDPEPFLAVVSPFLREHAA